MIGEVLNARDRRDRSRGSRPRKPRERPGAIHEDTRRGSARRRLGDAPRVRARARVERARNSRSRPNTHPHAPERPPPTARPTPSPPLDPPRAGLRARRPPAASAPTVRVRVRAPRAPRRGRECGGGGGASRSRSPRTRAGRETTPVGFTKDRRTNSRVRTTKGENAGLLFEHLARFRGPRGVTARVDRAKRVHRARLIGEYRSRDLGSKRSVSWHVGSDSARGKNPVDHDKFALVFTV